MEEFDDFEELDYGEFDDSLNLDDTVEPDGFQEDLDISEIDIDDETNLIEVLRDELKKKEGEREFLRFRYKGDICDGIPMAEINPSRFVFKIDDILQGINLSEIKIL